MRYAKVGVIVSFDAAHHLKFHQGLCQRPHGHTYQVEIVCNGPIQESQQSKKDGDFGMVVDFSKVKAVWHDEVEIMVDHYDLNNSPVLVDECPYPSAENLAWWICGRLARRLPQLERVRVWEQVGRSYAEVDRREQ